MIALSQGQANNVWMRLRPTLSVFLFVLTNGLTNESKYFLCTDTGTEEGTQLFVIEENATEDVLNGVVTLQPSGFWEYAVYEQSSTTNLDPANAILLETGKCQVTGEVSTNHTFINSTDTSFVYVNQ